jgi:hypothetical protein
MSIAATALAVRVEIALSNTRHPVLSLETYDLSLKRPPVGLVPGVLVRHAHSSTRKAACSLQPFTVGSQPPRQ